VAKAAPILRLGDNSLIAAVGGWTGVYEELLASPKWEMMVRYDWKYLEVPMPKSVSRPAQELDKAGLINPLLGFLERNLTRFSQPVRDTIGVGILLILLTYVLNGLIGSTYIRGQLFVYHEGIKKHAVGWKVLLGDNEAVTNDKGWWTLPLAGNGIPGRIRLEIEDAARDAAGNAREPVPMGEFYAFGPWPILNTFKPMNNLIVDIYPDRPFGKRLQVASSSLLSVGAVYAQSNESPQRALSQSSAASCALSLTRVKVVQFPGFLRSSGRAYFQMDLAGKPVDAGTLLYGPGIGSAAGHFPAQSDKELWLPVRTGSDDRYSDLLADLTDVADCWIDVDGKAQVRPKGRLTLKMFADNGEALNSFDLTDALRVPNQEVDLRGDPKQRAMISVIILARQVTRVNPKDGLTYVWIPPGKFTMGCSPGDTYCGPHGFPPHDVNIDKGFWIGQTEVTQDAYLRVTGKNRSYFKGARLPAENIDWNGALHYCQAVGMRLPTQAEWEYAARAGTKEGRYGKALEIAWYKENSEGKTHEVGQKQPNAWLLYDMFGNVWEFTSDPEFPKPLPHGDPPGLDYRELRGGAYDYSSGPVSDGVIIDTSNSHRSFGVRCVGDLR
jgi:formylglycine-generating enzyme required for sulfatase activity